MEYYSSLSEEQLFVLIKQNDQHAFAALYNRNWHDTLSYVNRAIGSIDVAQDIVQDIFISIWRRREVIEITTTFRAYLFKSARNLSIRHISTAGVQSQQLQLLADQMRAAELVVFDSLELDELEASVDRAIEKLPPKMREVFTLSRNENKSYREIAVMLGISETTVKKQISNALKSIRSDVESQKVYSFVTLFF